MEIYSNFISVVLCALSVGESMEELPHQSRIPRTVGKTVASELEAIRTEVRGIREDIRGFRSMRTEISELRSTVRELIALVRQALPFPTQKEVPALEEPPVGERTDEEGPTPIEPNMKFVELLHSGLFKKEDGKQLEFGILQFGKFSRSDNILAGNCAILIQVLETNSISCEIACPENHDLNFRYVAES